MVSQRGPRLPCHARRSATLLGGLWVALVSVNAVLRSEAPAPAAAVAGQEAGATFPSELGKLSLAATGIRRKYRAVQVYAVGFYLDRRSKLWGRSVKHGDLLKEALGKAKLRLVITSRLVSQEALADALRDSVQPRLEGLGNTEAEELMGEFSSALLNGPPLKKGTVLDFSLSTSGLQVQIDGDYSVEVKSTTLAKALLSTYTDKNAVIPEFREAILSALEHVD